ncbi:hypothetical protein ACGFZ9_52430, partial [Streptomyces mirabilis]|uniref:hypothetical protein n=1 Tax=Streptomyces mirabilis TaxID=68239 RepID=UPI003712D027
MASSAGRLESVVGSSPLNRQDTYSLSAVCSSDADLLSATAEFGASSNGSIVSHCAASVWSVSQPVS